MTKTKHDLKSGQDQKWQGYQNAKANTRSLEAKASATYNKARALPELGLGLTIRRVVVQGAGPPAQNIYQCRVQEDKAMAAASRKTSQTENDHAQTLNGNNVIAKPTSSHSLSSYHSQVSETPSSFRSRDYFWWW